VMGVEQDAATKYGVFPVLIGIRPDSASSCPAGYTYYPTSQLSNGSGGDGYSYPVMTDSSAMFGGVTGDSYGGATYSWMDFTSAQSIDYCYKFYPMQAGRRPHPVLRANVTGVCPSGFVKYPIGTIYGPNQNAYYIQTGKSVYLGGVNSDAFVDYVDGYIYNNYLPSQINTVCLNVENVGTYP
jgi:hypothetical protein